MADEKGDQKKLIKTLTFGLGKPYGYDPRNKNKPLVELTEDQRKTVYTDLRRVSEMIAAVCNILNAQEYVRKIMKVPKKLVDQFKPNYTPIVKRLEAAKIFHKKIVSGSVLSQTFALGVASDFAGQHGKEMLAQGKRQLPLHRTDGSHPIFERAKETKLIAIEGRHYLIQQIFSNDWATDNGLPSGWTAFPIHIKKRDQSLASQLAKVENGEWNLKNSRVFRRSRTKGRVWTGQIVVAYERTPLPQMKATTILGVDLGVNVPACVHICEDGKPQPWARKVGRGRDMLNTRGLVRNEIKRIIRSLKSKDSPVDPAYREELRRKLRDLRKREKRIMKTASQQIAALIAAIAKRNGAGKWQLEDLSADIKDDQPWLTRNWAPGMLLDALRWQANQLNVDLVLVNPRNTSRRCSSCGFTSEDNRPKAKMGASYFKCVKCGHEDDADKNAAKNLSIKEIDKIIAAEGGNGLDSK